MQQENLSEQTNLQLIESMINRAKNKFNENGTLYLLWGFVILTCCMTQFILLHFFHVQDAYYVWFLTLLTLIYQVIYLKNRQRKSKVKTYTADILKYVWISFVITIFMVNFILQFYKAIICINPLILVVYGIPTFLSGAIIKFRPLIWGGILCWALSIVASFITYEYQFLLLSLAVIGAWIIPGYLLRQRSKTQD